MSLHLDRAALVLWTVAVAAFALLRTPRRH
jgi:hypothetical protein